MYDQPETSLQNRLGNPGTSCFIHLPNTRRPSPVYFITIHSVAHRKTQITLNSSLSLTDTPPPIHSINKSCQLDLRVRSPRDHVNPCPLISPSSHLDSSKGLLIHLPTSTLVLLIIHYPKATRVIFQKCK